ncbi:MAG TPA: hypothetical protein VI432_02325, partial [Candidatus Paceibacterota bacterium]
MTKDLSPKIPEEVLLVAKTLIKRGHKAYLVGGCLRDLLIKKTPYDWDIATDAIPDEVQKVFKDTIYENSFGTVGVKTDSEDQRLKVIEVTTFRKEGKYTDKRHPDDVKFAETIQEDLARRDFTVNAIALSVDEKKSELIDPFDGMADLDKKIIRAVGISEERFEEDALRLLRAVRLATQLGLSQGWTIEGETKKAIIKKSHLLEFIAKERIRDEIIKLIMSDDAHDGVRLLEEVGLLKYI